MRLQRGGFVFGFQAIFHFWSPAPVGPVQVRALTQTYRDEYRYRETYPYRELLAFLVVFDFFDLYRYLGAKLVG